MLPEEAKISEKTKDRDLDDSGYIVVAFKTTDSVFCSMMEETWKDWTGARSIYLNLSLQFQPIRMHFYRKVGRNSIGSFKYILLVECENVTDKNKYVLIDYVQRLRISKMDAYVSVYTECPRDGDSNYYSNESLDETWSIDSDTKNYGSIKRRH